jgi:hypothetical protein
VGRVPGGRGLLLNCCLSHRIASAKSQAAEKVTPQPHCSALRGTFSSRANIISKSIVTADKYIWKNKKNQRTETALLFY